MFGLLCVFTTCARASAHSKAIFPYTRPILATNFVGDMNILHLQQKKELCVSADNHILLNILLRSFFHYPPWPSNEDRVWSLPTHLYHYDKHKISISRRHSNSGEWNKLDLFRNNFSQTSFIRKNERTPMWKQKHYKFVPESTNDKSRFGSFTTIPKLYTKHRIYRLTSSRRTEKQNLSKFRVFKPNADGGC